MVRTPSVIRKVIISKYNKRGTTRSLSLLCFDVEEFCSALVALQPTMHDVAGVRGQADLESRVMSKLRDAYCSDATSKVALVRLLCVSVPCLCSGTLQQLQRSGGASDAACVSSVPKHTAEKSSTQQRMMMLMMIGMAMPMLIRVKCRHAEDQVRLRRLPWVWDRLTHEG